MRTRRPHLLSVSDGAARWGRRPVQGAVVSRQGHPAARVTATSSNHLSAACRLPCFSKTPPRFLIHEYLAEILIHMFPFRRLLTRRVALFFFPPLSVDIHFRRREGHAESVNVEAGCSGLKVEACRCRMEQRSLSAPQSGWVGRHAGRSRSLPEGWVPHPWRVGIHPPNPPKRRP